MPPCAPRSSPSPSYREPRGPTRRDIGIDTDLVDPRPRRAPTDALFEAVERLAVPFGHDFHGAVRTVGDPAVDALDAGRFHREKPEAHTLDTSAQHEPPGFEHRHSIDEELPRAAPRFARRRPAVA